MFLLPSVCQGKIGAICETATGVCLVPVRPPPQVHVHALRRAAPQGPLRRAGFAMAHCSPSRVHSNPMGGFDPPPPTRHSCISLAALISCSKFSEGAKEFLLGSTHPPWRFLGWGPTIPHQAFPYSLFCGGLPECTKRFAGFDSPFPLPVHSILTRMVVSASDTKRSFFFYYYLIKE